MALLWLFVAAVSAHGFVMGPGSPSEMNSTIRIQTYNSSASVEEARILFETHDRITGTWMDFESQTLFVATRAESGCGRIGRTSVPDGSSRGIYWFGGSIAGVVYGLTGSRALLSPSIYWVWDPTASSSPPHTGRPTLYRMPLLGGYPEVVTLHARRCVQMTIVKQSLFCLEPNLVSFFNLALPNSAFVPVSMPSDFPYQGLVAARDESLYLLGASGRLYSSSRNESILFPTNLDAQQWGVNVYSPPTDCLLLRAENGVLWQWIGLDSFWSDLLTQNETASAIRLGNTSLWVSVFSGANRLVQWSGVSVACVGLVIFLL